MVGCTTTALNSKLISHEDNLNALKQQITDMEDTLGDAIVDSCGSGHAPQPNLNNDDEVKHLILQLSSARQKLSDTQKKCKATQTTKPKKLIFGNVEQVFFIDKKLQLSARVDTGAETSSLGIYQLKEFERDSKSWVSFKLKDSADAPIYEYPVHDNVLIKVNSKTNESNGDQRFEVKINIAVGGKEYRKQKFNLADRSHLEHQVLLGRNFLRDIAIVDVSLKNQQSNKR